MPSSLGSEGLVVDVQDVRARGKSKGGLNIVRVEGAGEGF